MHFKQLLLAGIISISAFGSINAQAATGYKRTKTTSVSKKAYYTTNVKGSTYRNNKSTKHFVFKANHALKNYKNTTWTRTKKTTITKHGKKYLYYYVHNSKNNAAGWIYSKYLKAGKNYQATTPTAYKGTFTKFKAGKIYTIHGKNSAITFKKVAPLASKTNYKVTQKRYVYKHGKKYLYYKVSKTKKSATGWVWHKYLLKGKYTKTSSANKTTSSNTSTIAKPTTDKPATSQSSSSSVASSSSSSSVVSDPAYTYAEVDSYELTLLNAPLDSYIDLAKENKVDISGFVNATNDLKTMFSDMRAKKVLKNQQSLDKINKLLAVYKTQSTAMADTLKPFPEFNPITKMPFKEKGYVRTDCRLYSKPEYNYTNKIGMAKAFSLVYFDTSEPGIVRDATTGITGYAQNAQKGIDIAPASGYYRMPLGDGKTAFNFSIENPNDVHDKDMIHNDGELWYQTDINTKENIIWTFNDGTWSQF